MKQTHVSLLLLCTCLCFLSVQAGNNASTFEYTRGPVPQSFSLGQHYPSRNETQVCRPIRLRIERNSRLYRTNLVVNGNPDITFMSSDARLMTPRLQTKLNTLAEVIWEQVGLRITILQAWREYSMDDGIEDPHSLHYEGRTVRVSVQHGHASLFLHLAVEAGFDWVYYASYDYIRLSVIPDVCDANLDLVFMLDQSGSVGRQNHDVAIDFMRDVSSFFNIAANTTQVGLVTFSDGARIEFGLNTYNNIYSLLYAFSRIQYRGGYTTTAYALLLASYMLDPALGYGARPASEGIPKVAVLITDGRSNIYPITEIAPFLRNSGVQVYTVGIGNIYLPELQFIASDPDELHVFLLDSFSDAPNFVDFLSFTTCDTPAIVEPGDNTTTEVEEDRFRFFQSECAAFSVTVMIEQIDLVGSCSLYASAQEPNPGPLSPTDVVVRNENRQVNRRSVHLNLPSRNKFVYVSVRGHSAYNTFSIIIWDMIFSEDLYTVYVSEGVSGMTIFDLNAELRTTNVTFNYSITEGNEYGFFDINSQNGLLYVVSELSADYYDYFLLTIVAQNSQYSCHRGRVKIKIVVIRDNIQFPELQPVSIPENSDIGSPVTQVQATGADSSIVYSITGGNIGNAFQIGESDGLITVASQLNFEIQNTYSLTIQATSSATGSTGSTVQVVNIDDVNEQPFFTNQCASMSSCVFSVDEGQLAGATVDTLFADDPDLPSLLNGMVFFNISTASGDMVPFTLQQNDRQAVLLTSTILDRESEASYNFSVIVTDRGLPALSSVIAVSVVVNDVNDNAPVFLQAEDVLPVGELTPVMTNITQYVTSDADIGSNAEIVFSIMSTTNPIPFEIDPVTGVLRVSGALDFENTTFYILNVTASNPDGLQSNSTQTVILVQDANDNPPVFSQDEYFGSVVEHADDDTAILTIFATDKDSGDNGMIIFTIVSGNVNNLISISSATNEIGVFQMRVGGVIDREEIQVFNLTVRAVDLGNPPMESFARVIINVLDINDHPPIFLPRVYSAMLREDSPPMNILNVFAFDADQPFTPNTDLVFEITQGNVGDVFSLNRRDNNTATLRLVGGLDFETLNLYELQVTATDQGDPPMNGTASIRIEVTNVNEVPPLVGGNQTIFVSENTLLGTTLAQINASDVDSTRISFSILSVVGVGVNGETALGVFNISQEGIVSLAAGLDFESSPNFTIQIQVSDGQLTATTILTVNVIDENEFSPELNSTTFAIQEEQPANTIVGTVLATDGDAGSGSVVTYQIINEGPVSSLFNISSQSGVITTSQVLDREQLVEQFDLFLPSRGSTSSIRVQAIDNGMPAFFTVAEIGITLLDINDNAPIFEQISDGFAVPVRENRPQGEVVFNVQATDGDLGLNGEITYSLDVLNPLSGSPIPFSIDPDLGRIVTEVMLDHEERNQYMVRVTARDGGSLPMSSSATIIVLVIDENDNDPIFSQPSYETTVFENTTVPVNVIQVSANDSDAGPNGAVIYSIQFTNPSSSLSLFSIAPNSGQITLLSELDFESVPVHALTVSARDSGAPPRSSTVEVTVRVGNIDEVPPRFISPCAVTVRESISPGIPIAQCRAQDIDDVTNNTMATVRYQILQGNINDTFSISSDGTITVVRRLDRETIDFYSILIQATDSAGLSDTTLFNVTVSDVNDNAPVIINAPATVTVGQSDILAQTLNFFTIQARDDDIGINAQLQYSLIEIMQQPNGTSTELTIRVSDLGSSSLSSTTTVVFQFVEPCTVQEYSINSTDGRIFSQFLCAVTVQPQEVNVTMGSSVVLFCNVLRNIENTMVRWMLNGSFITVPTLLAPNDPIAELLVPNASFQDAGEYTCIVSTPIGNLQSTNIVVRVVVPPVITIPPVDMAAELGRSVQFTCFADGVPSPSIEWSRPLVGGGNQVLVQTGRILPFNTFLVISTIQNGDQGIYTCTAINPAGEAAASATLTIFGLANVVTVELTDFSNPNADNTCHELNSTEFESIMTDITGVKTMTTGQSGENLCNKTACSPSPCQNGGSCEIDPDTEGYICTCSVGYTGENCETDIDECTEGACMFGGSCTNEPGSFSCACLPEFTGHRCQYSTVCESQAPCEEDSNETCIATIANMKGYVCEDLSDSTGAIIVTMGGDGTSPGLLDDQVNTIQEMLSTTENSKRRRRQTNSVDSDNGFVTTCEARFIAATQGGSRDVRGGELVLVWACPESLEAPSGNELDEICQELFSKGLVSSCRSPTGISLVRSPINTERLPSTNVAISFILVDTSGAPLSGSEVLNILEESNSLARLRAQGFEAVNFTAAVSPPQQEGAKQDPSTAMIVTIVIAVLVAALLAGFIFLAVCLVRTWQTRKKKPDRNVGPRKSGHNLQSGSTEIRGSQENLLIENPYTKMDSLNLQHEQKFTFPSVSSHHNVIETSPQHTIENETALQQTEPIFDDDTYASGYIPPSTAKPPEHADPRSPVKAPQRPKRHSSKRKSLERKASVVKERVASSFKRKKTESENRLLQDEDEDDDYDEILTVQSSVTQRERLPQSSQHSEEEVIYGNVEHQKTGAMGNAGERWESYWKTNTLIRSPEHGSAERTPPSKK